MDNPRLRFLNTHERVVFERLRNWWLGGGGNFDVQDTSTSTTLVLPASSTQVDVDTTAGDVTVTLPPADENIGKRVEVTKVVAANDVVVASADLIDGSASITWATQWKSYTLISRGDTWRIA